MAGEELTLTTKGVQRPCWCPWSMLLPRKTRLMHVIHSVARDHINVHHLGWHRNQGEVHDLTAASCHRQGRVLLFCFCFCLFAFLLALQWYQWLQTHNWEGFCDKTPVLPPPQISNLDRKALKEFFKIVIKMLKCCSLRLMAFVRGWGHRREGEEGFSFFNGLATENFNMLL